MTPGGSAPRPAALTATLGAATACAATLLLGVPALLVPSLVTVAWTVTMLLVRRRRATAAAARRVMVIDSVEAMLGELQAGQPPGHALARAAEVWPELAHVAAAHRLGADVPAALRETAALPGAQAVRHVGAAWQLCAAGGAGLADALEQVLATVRGEHDVRLAVAAELAAARATVRLVAVLPLLVLGMGGSIGAEPWSFLLATHAGQGCLWAGTTLAAGGVVWLERIADQAHGQEP